MQKITINVPDDCKVQVIKKEEEENPIIRTSQDLIDNDYQVSDSEDSITSHNGTTGVIKGILLITSIILGFAIIFYIAIAIVRWDISWIVSAEPAVRILFVGCMTFVVMIVCGCADV